MTNPAQETGSRRDMLRRRVGSLLCVLLTLTIGFAGVQGFIYLQLPLPWMLGAMFAVLSGAVIKMPLQAPRILLSPMRAVLGLMIGSAFTPQLLHQIDQFLISLVFVFPYIAILALIGVPYYRLLPRFNFPTAFFAAMPGGLAEITVLGSDVGADTRKLALVHSTRLLILLFTLPFLVETLIKVDLSTPRAIGPSLMTMDWTEQAILLILGMFGWLIAKKLHMSGASLVGPMLLSAAAHLSGIVQSVPQANFCRRRSGCWA
ncbi:AbrB family transcriptional regulator [Marinobacterium aestuariivivens]|uniref:AbrB family transcriptional regulator n=1 Tax=Marinobacterium aestuariivivens TaxID=1698799 RepID=A0ABW2A9S8_9GAMM